MPTPGNNHAKITARACFPLLDRLPPPALRPRALSSSSSPLETWALLPSHRSHQCPVKMTGKSRACGTVPPVGQGSVLCLCSSYSYSQIPNPSPSVNEGSLIRTIPPFSPITSVRHVSVELPLDRADSRLPPSGVRPIDFLLVHISQVFAVMIMRLLADCSWLPGPVQSSQPGAVCISWGE